MGRSVNVASSTSLPVGSLLSVPTACKSNLLVEGDAEYLRSGAVVPYDTKYVNAATLGYAIKDNYLNITKDNGSVTCGFATGSGLSAYLRYINDKNYLLNIIGNSVVTFSCLDSTSMAVSATPSPIRCVIPQNQSLTGVVSSVQLLNRVSWSNGYYVYIEPIWQSVNSINLYETGVNILTSKDGVTWNVVYSNNYLYGATANTSASYGALLTCGDTNMITVNIGSTGGLLGFVVTPTGNITNVSSIYINAAPALSFAIGATPWGFLYAYNNTIYKLTKAQISENVTPTFPSVFATQVTNIISSTCEFGGVFGSTTENKVTYFNAIDSVVGSTNASISSAGILTKSGVTNTTATTVTNSYDAATGIWWRVVSSQDDYGTMPSDIGIYSSTNGIAFTLRSVAGPSRYPYNGEVKITSTHIHASALQSNDIVADFTMKKSDYSIVQADTTMSSIPHQRTDDHAANNIIVVAQDGSLIKTMKWENAGGRTILTIHRSTDGGALWSTVFNQKPVTGDNYCRVTFLKVLLNGEIVIGYYTAAVTNTFGVITSTDNGATWTKTQIATSASTIYDVVFDGTYYLLVCNAATKWYRSTNLTAWTASNGTFASGYATAATAGTGRVVAPNTTTIYYTDDAGTSAWSTATGTPGKQTNLIFWDSSTSKYYAFMSESYGNNSIIYSSSDGAAWASLTTSAKLGFQTPKDCIKFNGIYYVVCGTSEVYYSTNMISWQRKYCFEDVESFNGLPLKFAVRDNSLWLIGYKYSDYSTYYTNAMVMIDTTNAANTFVGVANEVKIGNALGYLRIK